jgi:hypothetical protein
MEGSSQKRPTLGSLIPIVTGVVALTGAVTYAIMRYSYQQFYDRLGLTPDDFGPSSASALTQSGIRVATFVLLFAVLPVALALVVSQGLVALLRRFRAPLVLVLLLPVIAALGVYRLFTWATNGGWEIDRLVVLAAAVLLLTSKRLASIKRVPSTGWIVTTTLVICGALVLSGSLPKDARTTVRRCLVERNLPVRWIHTHRTFFWGGNLNHMAVLQVRADPAQMLSPGDLSNETLPGSKRLVYLGDAGGRAFVFDREQRRTLQVPDGDVVVATKPARHCHWWHFKS